MDPRAIIFKMPCCNTKRRRFGENAKPTGCIRFIFDLIEATKLVGSFRRIPRKMAVDTQLDNFLATDKIGEDVKTKSEVVRLSGCKTKGCRFESQS